MILIFRYGSLLLLFLLFVYGIASDDNAALIRYNHYPVFLTPVRFVLLMVAFLFSLYCARSVTGGFWGTMTPANTFLLLFLTLVMPGILLTPDTSPRGTVTFYYFWAATMVFLISLTASARALKDMRPKPSFSRVYKSDSPEFMFFCAVYVISLAILVGSGQISALVFNQMLNFMQDSEVSNIVAEGRQVGAVSGYGQVATNYMMTIGLPLSSAFVLINGIVGARRGQIVAGSFMALISVVVLLSLGGRLAALFAVLFFLVAYSMVRKIKFSQVITLSSILCWMLILQTIALGRLATAGTGRSTIEIMILSLNRVVERVFLVKGYVSQRALEFFPSGHKFLYGRSYSDALFGLEEGSPSLAQEMANYIFGGYNATAGPQAFGEAYANFGLIGMLAVAGILGVFVAVATRFVARRIQLDAFRVVFLAYFTVLIARTGYGEFFTFKSNGIHVLGLLYLMFALVRREKIGRVPITGSDSEMISSKQTT